MCYEVTKGKSVDEEIEVENQFETFYRQGRLTVKEPVMFCDPVDKKIETRGHR